MSSVSSLRERPRGSRTDDLRTTHILLSPETGAVEAPRRLDAAPCAVTRQCDRTLSRLGPAPHWPVLTRPRLAGFHVSTEGILRSHESPRPYQRFAPNGPWTACDACDGVRVAY